MTPVSPGDPAVSILPRTSCGLTQSPGQEAFRLPWDDLPAASEHFKALPDMTSFSLHAGVRRDLGGGAGEGRGC